MAVKLRLRRLGRKKLPVWGIVAADGRKSRDGRYIEDLGRYFPLEEPARVELNQNRILHWLEVGAQPSDTVRSILSKHGLLLALHLKRKGASQEEIDQAVDDHRAKHAAQAEQAIKLTPQARRQQALEEERERVAKEEAEEAKRKAEAEAKRKAEEEARKKAEAEAKKKAEEEAKAAEAAEEDTEETTEAAADTEEVSGTEETSDTEEAEETTTEAASDDAAADEAESASEEAADEGEDEAAADETDEDKDA